MARASQRPVAKHPWPSEENAGPERLGDRALQECGAPAHGRKCLCTRDQSGEDGQHRTPLRAIRRQRAPGCQQHLDRVAQTALTVLERQSRAVGVRLYTL